MVKRVNKSVRKNFRFTEESNYLLKQLSEKRSLDETALIEVLIKEAAAKEKIKLPKSSS